MTIRNRAAPLSRRALVGALVTGVVAPLDGKLVLLGAGGAPGMRLAAL